MRSAEGHGRRWVYLGHFRSEAEGNRAKACREELQYGDAFVCEVSSTKAGAVVATDVTTYRGDRNRGTWLPVTSQELATGVPSQDDPLQTRVDPEQVYFVRSVEVVHSQTFVTTVQEYVRAPNFAAANTMWAAPLSALEEIATDPTLAFPKPADRAGGS